MATEVILPRVDPGMTEARIVEWYKKEGDSVEEGDVLYTIETDKVTFEVQASASGVLVQISAKADETVQVGKVVAFIIQPGEKIPDIVHENDIQTIKETGLPYAEKAEKDKNAIRKDTLTTEGTTIKASPLVKRLAKEHNIDLTSVKGTGLNGEITKKDVLMLVERGENTGKV